MAEKYMRITTQQLLLDIAVGGIEYNKEMAKMGPCKSVDIGNGKKLYFDGGIIGTLNDEQVKEYCEKAEEYKVGKELGRKASAMDRASEKCKIGAEHDGTEIKDLNDRLLCIISEVNYG